MLAMRDTTDVAIITTIGNFMFDAVDFIHDMRKAVDDIDLDMVYEELHDTIKHVLKAPQVNDLSDLTQIVRSGAAFIEECQSTIDRVKATNPELIIECNYDDVTYDYADLVDCYLDYVEKQRDDEFNASVSDFVTTPYHDKDVETISDNDIQRKLNEIADKADSVDVKPVNVVDHKDIDKLLADVANASDSNKEEDDPFKNPANQPEVTDDDDDPFKDDDDDELLKQAKITLQNPCTPESKPKNATKKKQSKTKVKSKS